MLVYFRDSIQKVKRILYGSITYISISLFLWILMWRAVLQLNPLINPQWRVTRPLSGLSSCFWSLFIFPVCCLQARSYKKITQAEKEEWRSKVQAAWGPARSFHSQWWFWDPCNLLVLVFWDLSYLRLVQLRISGVICKKIDFKLWKSCRQLSEQPGRPGWRSASSLKGFFT